MKTYLIIRNIIIGILVVGFILPIVNWILNPGSLLSQAPYLQFISPAIFLLICLVFMPKITQVIFNIALIVGIAVFAITAIVFPIGPVPLALFILGACGLYYTKKQLSNNHDVSR